MQKRPNKTLGWVFGVHASAIFLLLVIPFFKSCTHRKPKEIIPGVIIVSEAPAQVAAAPQPAPKIEKPAPTPEPKKTTPAPKTEKPAPAPKPKKPAWKPAKVIPQNKRVIRQDSTPAPKPQQPAARPKRDLSVLKQVLSSTADPHTAYCGQIEPRFYTVWRQPTAEPYGTKATAVIRVGADGSIVFRTLTAPSGNTVFDQSVKAALHAVKRLPAPPSVSINRNITIDFVLD